VTTFVDGPAAGATLMLTRAPLFLRAVVEFGSEWDALDQLQDRPKATERICVYRRDGAPGRIHIKRDRRHGGCGWFTVARYRVVEPQPDDATLRDQARFEVWAINNRDRGI